MSASAWHEECIDMRMSILASRLAPRLLTVTVLLTAWLSGCCVGEDSCDLSAGAAETIDGGVPRDGVSATPGCAEELISVEGDSRVSK